MAINHYYVDPSLGTDSGDGTVGSPWGRVSGSVVQHALYTITQGAIGDIDQINIKEGTDDVLSAALDFTTYGTPSNTIGLILRGYTSAANDGGVGGISGGGSVGIVETATLDFVQFIHLHLHNCGTTAVLNLDDGCTIQECEIDNTTSTGISAGSSTLARGNHIHNCGGNGIIVDGNSVVMHNYLKNGTNDFANAIRLQIAGSTVFGNIISIDGASNGIFLNNETQLIHGNSILSAGGTGSGIEFKNGAETRNTSIFNNLIEGFSGTGGIGLNMSPPTNYKANAIANNALYNNTTNYSLAASNTYENDNETLTGSPFAKSGSDTFANRYTYFAPADEGNVLGGALQ